MALKDYRGDVLMQPTLPGHMCSGGVQLMFTGSAEMRDEVLELARRFDRPESWVLRRLIIAGMRKWDADAREGWVD
ncbi:hypothetical protein [Paucibacter soli]|uniref:hypothetical protein n=1 Tax=Paucibacter soli TaxID=3133433 RepID=UPI0030A85672